MQDFDADDNRFYKRHVFFRKGETLDWIIDRAAQSPEDDIISVLDGEPAEDLPPLPLGWSQTLPAHLDEDLLWIWRCREAGLGWSDIAPMIGLKTAGGAWKRFQRLLRQARKNAGN